MTSSRCLLFPLAGHERFAASLVEHGFGAPGSAVLRSFPDGETLVRVLDDVRGRTAAVVASLARPDEQLARLLLLAGTLRDLGASRVGLVAPYLAYLRQDARFEAGEGITSVYFARVLSASFDWLVTVDPHLHRYESLDRVYSIPSLVVRAAPAISAWIREQVVRPLVLGPDVESEPWVREVGGGAGAPHAVARKIRRGDREVDVELPALEPFRGCMPVIVDDIVSTARTQIATVRGLIAAGWPAPVCIAVHALFAGDALNALQAAGAARVVTCDTVPHSTNGIRLGRRVAAEINDWTRAPG